MILFFKVTIFVTTEPQQTFIFKIISTILFGVF